LLIYLAEVTDIDTAIQIANCVQNCTPVSEGIDDFITQIAEL
jgi:hypothetical protein